MEEGICVEVQGSSGLLKIQIFHRLLIQELYFVDGSCNFYWSVTFYAQLILNVLRKSSSADLINLKRPWLDKTTSLALLCTFSNNV